MATKKRGLGRGLDALLADTSPQQNDNTTPGDNTLQYFPLDNIQPGKYQPRIDMSQESLEELADSIRAQGLVQPIVIRPVENGKYEIVAGERRWRASRIAGLMEVPVLIRDVSDRNAIAMALIENIQRENLNPMEEANALFRLREEFELTHQQAAEAVGKSRTTVTNLLRLRNLNEDVKRMVENADLEMGHARALLSLEGDLQSDAAHQVVEKGLSVRETERLIRRFLKPVIGQKPEAKTSMEIVEDIEKRLISKLGKTISVKHRPNGKGKVIFDYANIDDLKKLIKQIGV